MPHYRNRTIRCYQPHQRSKKSTSEIRLVKWARKWSP